MAFFSHHAAWGCPDVSIDNLLDILGWVIPILLSDLVGCPGV
ncbi:hypothetical protein V8P97_02545 [Bifidobacterium sp. IMAU50988]|uniref:Uncharacterized protein n=1 Tax=Bifidobacterium favimelis TaxID=3122979 RepID=A0ABU8ZNM6_9BIFI